MWALRDAVAAAGYYSSGKFPEEYYLRLAQEIDNACSKGRLDCYPAARNDATAVEQWIFTPSLEYIP